MLKAFDVQVIAFGENIKKEQGKVEVRKLNHNEETYRYLFYNRKNVRLFFKFSIYMFYIVCNAEVVYRFWQRA